MPEHNKEQDIEVQEISCEVCFKSISATADQSDKTDDSVAYFCGQNCYNKWKQQKLDYNTNFLIGIYCLWNLKYKKARNFFLSAIAETETQKSKYHDIYASYLGLSNVLLDYKNGVLNHSNHSSFTSNTSLHLKPEIQLNQACAELIKGDRGSAFKAMSKIKRSKLSVKASEEMHSFLKIIGEREENENGTLKRENLVHKTMGKMFRKKDNFNTAEYIEAFIIDATRKRYERDCAKLISINGTPHQ